MIPGVTAALGGGAVLGAPLIHDFCLISLSDLLTPWEKIEKRLLAAAEADFVVCLYNPSSKKRHDYLEKACDLMMRYKSPETVCGIVSNIGREGETGRVMSLKELRDTRVDMFTTVFVGNSQTTAIDGKMVTPGAIGKETEAMEKLLLFAGTTEGRSWLGSFWTDRAFPATCARLPNTAGSCWMKGPADTKSTAGGWMKPAWRR